MRIKKLFSSNRNQKGFTLIELLVSVAISGIIGATIVAITFQIVAVNSADSNRMDAVKQLENALHWINRDAQTAWPTPIPPDDTTEISFPLTLEWEDYGDDANINIVNYIITNGELERKLTITAPNGTVVGIPITTRIANNIDASSYYKFNGEILTVHLTATVEGFRTASETRTLQVKPRTFKQTEGG